MRELNEIIKDIKKCWRNMDPHAAVYLAYLTEIKELNDTPVGSIYSGRGLITRFLVNAINWRTEDARRIKDELKQLLKEK